MMQQRHDGWMSSLRILFSPSTAERSLRISPFQKENFTNKTTAAP